MTNPILRVNRIISALIAMAMVFSLSGTVVFAEESNTAVKGYVWNPETGETQEYYVSPEECLPEIVMTEGDKSPYYAPNAETTSGIMPRLTVRTFQSYSPTSYTYRYNEDLFKIGTVRVDNKNGSCPATMTFQVTQSNSCSTTLTAGTEYGGEVDAIFAKAQLRFNAEVKQTVSWTKGTVAGSSTTVPVGQIGSITAYVIGIYSAGTATYKVFDSTSNKEWTNSVGIGGLIPTTNAWNLVVKVPSN